MFSDLLNTDDRANVVVVVIVTCDEKEVFEDDDDVITFDFKNDDVIIFDFKEHVDVEADEWRFVPTTTDDVLHCRHDGISWKHLPAVATRQQRSTKFCHFATTTSHHSWHQRSPAASTSGKLFSESSSFVGPSDVGLVVEQLALLGPPLLEHRGLREHPRRHRAGLEGRRKFRHSRLNDESAVFLVTLKTRGRDNGEEEWTSSHLFMYNHHPWFWFWDKTIHVGSLILCLLIHSRSFHSGFIFFWIIQQNKTVQSFWSAFISPNVEKLMCCIFLYQLLIE